MDNTLYVALSRQMILRREMDVIANNVANADTAGFKVESVISQTDPQSLPAPINMGPKNVQFALDTGLARNFGQGAVTRTGAPLDMAISGDGFFEINTPRGTRFTRDGRFTTDATGRLTNAHGDAVADDAGGEITLDPTKGEPSISKDGVISQAGQRVGKIGVYRFGSLSGLAKDGDSLFRNDSNQTPQIATDAQIAQGAVEGSNVQPVLEVTRMMEVSREYQTISRMMDQTAELDRQSIQRLGKIAA
jgi:flagellar basal-body rod protein FlgF